jgi:hypothetical protein
MTPERAKTLSRVLSQIEKDLLKEIYNHVAGDLSEFAVYRDLYAIGERLGLSKDEVYRYSISLDNHGLLEAEPVIGERIARVKITVDGAVFVVLVLK